MLKTALRALIFLIVLVPTLSRAQQDCDTIDQGVSFCVGLLPLEQLQRTQDNAGYYYLAQSSTGQTIRATVTAYELPQWEQVVQADAIIESTINAAANVGVSRDQLQLLFQNKTPVTDGFLQADSVAVAFIKDGQNAVTMRSIFIDEGYALLVATDETGTAVSDTMKALHELILGSILLPATIAQPDCEPMLFNTSFCASNIPLLNMTANSQGDGFVFERGDTGGDIFVFAVNEPGLTQQSLRRILDQRFADDLNTTVDQLRFIVQMQMPMGDKTADVSTYTDPSATYPTVETTAIYLGDGYAVHVQTDNFGSELSDGHISLFNEIMANIRVSE